jgi:DNA repair protein RecO (recombination protein O)
VIYTTRAIVFRTVKFGETSLITDLYTEQKGLQTFMIHSVRKVKATTPASYLQLMSLVEVVGYFKESRKIHHIKEVRLAHPYQTIPFDPEKSAVITCLAEMCSKCITTADPHPELFTYLFDSLVSYDATEGIRDRNFLIRFLVGLSQYLGFGFELEEKIPPLGYFDLQQGHVVPKATSHLYLMSIDDYRVVHAIMKQDPAPVHIDQAVRRRILDQVITYFQLHVESLKEVNSIRVLRELF